MPQYEIINNTLKLRVKRSSLFARVILLLFTIAFFTFPSIGMILAVMSRRGFHFGFMIGILLFGLIGFFFLRLFLWNSYGEEVIEFEKEKATYEVDYRWFKGGKETKDMDKFVFSLNRIGYEDENIATLVIGENQNKIESVIKMPLGEIEDLIKLLEKKIQ